MKKLILSLVILFSCHSAHAATVQGDADSNGALDVAKGGTNATTAADARTSLGVPATASTLVGDCTVGPCLDGSTDGGNLIKLWAGTGSYWTALQGGAPAANRSWRLPIAAPPAAGATQLMLIDEYGQMGFLPITDTTGKVLSQTTDGVYSWIANGAGSMVYPGAGLAVSTGSAWTTSLACSNDADVIEWDTTTSKFVCVTPVTYTAGTSISLAGNQISVTGLVIGTNVQAYDADLTTWAGVTPSANGQSLVSAANYAAMRTLLDLEAGTDFNAYDADLTTWAGITPGTGVGTMLGNAPGAEGGPTTTIEAGTSALGTSEIASGACASAVTTAATNAATTDVINWGFNGDPTGVTGYAPTANGMLTIIAYPTSGNVNFKVCNLTASAITPGAITLNWRIQR